jgi:hypothetical protein
MNWGRSNNHNLGRRLDEIIHLSQVFANRLLLDIYAPVWPTTMDLEFNRRRNDRFSCSYEEA